jgi:ribosomal protein S18 acetylase RimI-like enzyme
VTRSRHKKAAYDTARRLFRARRGLQEPAPSPSKNSKHLLMVREHMREIPQVQLPEGYTMRGMRIEDIGVWTDIERDAEEYFTVRDSLFMDQFGDDLPSIGHRCFILRDPRGLGVGTISAWYNRDFRGQDWGRIHWVALRRSHQGRGLGKAMLTHAMNVLAKHHDRAYLDTDTRRVAAVALYRKYGFRVE